MNELSPQARAMLGIYKVDVLPSARRDVANWTAIAERIAANEPPLFDDVEPQERSRWPLVAISLAAVAAVAAALLLFVGGVSPFAMDHDPAMNAAPYGWNPDAPGGEVTHKKAGSRRTAPADAGSEPVEPTDAMIEPTDAMIEPVEPVEPTEPVEPAAAVVEPPVVRPRRARSTSPRASTKTADDLGAEAASLARARAELRDDRPNAALRRLARHARRFPQGSLAKERRVLEIVARCEAGQRSRARREAQRFIRDNPGSPLTARVRPICSP